MSKKLATPISKSKQGVFARTKLYTFELLMSIVGLLVTAFVVDYGIFSVFRHVTREGQYQQDFSDFIIFIIAAMIVWLPVAITFYLRARGEMQLVVARLQSRLHKALTSIFMFINIIAAIGALFYAVYMLLQFALGTSDDTTNSLLRFVVPGFLMALWHGWLFFAYSTVRFNSRKQVAVIVSTVTVVVVVALFVLTASGIRAQALDAKREMDVNVISQAIKRHNTAEKQLPSSLDDLKIDDLNFSKANYRYEKINNTQYKVCADFSAEGSSNYNQIRDDAYSTYRYDDDYTYAPILSDHGKGEHCYKLKVSPRSTYYRNNSTKLDD